jgi:hypothetical protein
MPEWDGTYTRLRRISSNRSKATLTRYEPSQKIILNQRLLSIILKLTKPEGGAAAHGRIAAVQVAHAA